MESLLCWMVGAFSHLPIISSSPTAVQFFPRFVDHDMIMHYHWGLGVGHIYSSDCSNALARPSAPDSIEELGEIDDAKVELPARSL